MAADDFARLELLCRRASSLPVLPTTALQLIRSIDSGDASAAELEKIIVNDPGLSAEFLRLASNGQLGKQNLQLTSIRASILRMGQRTVRALATSLLVRDMVRSDSACPLDKKQFARHSLAVGLLAKFLFARRKMTADFPTRWSPDEMFAAGLLSDLGYVLIARMLPDMYRQLRLLAKKKGVSLDDAFIAAFGKPVSTLGAAAAETWNLPDVFSLSLAHLHAPWEHLEESAALSCLNYASALAKDFGLGIEDWTFEVAVNPQVIYEVGLEDAERENLKEVLIAQLETHSEIFGAQDKTAA